MMDDFRYIVWLRRCNRTLQVVLALSLFFLLNYIVSLRYYRQDLTEKNRFSLSPESVAYLKGITQPVKIIVTKPQEDAPPESKIVFNHLDDLLREYVHLSRNSHNLITVDYINIYRQTDKAEELVQRYGVHPENENAMVVTSGERYREVIGPELYEVLHTGENVFTGEQALTSAILEVAQAEPKKIYFLEGHGEMMPDDVTGNRGLSRAIDFLQQRNYHWDVVDLMKHEAIPSDADALFIVAPDVPLLPEEIQVVREYLNDANGRVVVFLNPAREHGMEDLFYEWGILSDDMLVLEPSEEFIAAGGDMLVNRFAEHPITQLLIDSQQRVLVGLSRPVRLDPGSSLSGGIRVTPLLGSSDASWAERSYRQQGQQQYDKSIDLSGPVSLAAVSERGDASDLGLALPGGKLVVFGNAALISNQRFSIAANSVLFHNLVGWTLEQDGLLGVPPRPYELKQLTLSRAELISIFANQMWLPVGVALVGLLVAFLRRR